MKYSDRKTHNDGIKETNLFDALKYSNEEKAIFP
jgi:hypothetical protein